MILLEHSVWAFLVSLCVWASLYETVTDYHYFWSGWRGKEPIVLGYWSHLVICFVTCSLCPGRFLGWSYFKNVFLLTIGLYLTYISQYFLFDSKLMVRLMILVMLVPLLFHVNIKISLSVSTKTWLGFW